MRVPFRIVDVFTEAPFAGNRLCVVPEVPAGLGSKQMQMLALEFNFSETTFVTAARPDGYDVRIFTPVSELPFAGHPTLGTAFVLASEGRTATTVIQTCAAGDVPVEVDLAGGGATMHQLPPVFGRPYEDRGAVALAAGLLEGDLREDLPIVPVSTGIAHLMVPVRDERALRRAARHASAAEACSAADEAESLYLFAVLGEGDVMARMFDRSEAIGEDPATGSAAGPLGAYLSVHGLAGMPGAVTIRQGELTGRPSTLRVTTKASDGTWLIAVSGGVRRTGAGGFEL